jgi:hypothetical protein
VPAHFQLQDDRLAPLDDGASGRDARYTEQVYRLNDPRRVELRRQRRELINDRMRLLEIDPAELRRMAKKQPSQEKRARMIELARKLAHLRARALDELRARSAIPRDAPMACRCGNHEHPTLPPGTPVLYLE